MRYFYFNWQIVVFLIFGINPAFTASMSPEISRDAAVKQANTVVVGFFTGHSTQNEWNYHDQFDNDGNQVPHSIITTAYEFLVHEIIDGEVVPKNINIYVIGGELKNSLAEQFVRLADLKQKVVLKLIPDSGASQRGYSGFNVVHGYIQEVENVQHLRQIQYEIIELRREEPEHTEAQIERDIAEAMKMEENSGDYINTDYETRETFPDDPLESVNNDSNVSAK